MPVGLRSRSRQKPALGSKLTFPASDLACLPCYRFQMHGIMQACLDTFKFALLWLGALVPTCIAAQLLGRGIAGIFNWDDQIPMAVCFFAALALEVWAYDRYCQWQYLRSIR
jgi:hypothetical protein